MKCETCQKEMRLIKAGLSKAGKKYDAFYSCDRECGTTAKAEQTLPETPPEDTGGTILMEKLAEIETAIGNQTLAIDGLGERLDKMADWIKTNVK